MQFRDYTFLGTTQSLCPECLALVPAKIIQRGNRVYFRKRCDEHGVREDFVCSDANWYDRLEYSVPGRPSREYGVEPDRGCPYDCGLCTEHEQHSCIGLLEMTTSCNLTCPMCYSSSAPGGKHLTFEQCRAVVDRLVEVEGRAEVLQLSGGEPTIHPDLLQVVDYAYQQPIDIIMINTNGIRFANDPAMLEALAKYRERLEVYLQLDGLNDEVYVALRGEPLLDVKLRAVERLGEHGIRVTPVCTLQPGVNEDQIGPLVEFACERPWISGLSFQPATYSGRHVLPDELERRITFPDVIKAVAQQTNSLFREDDFIPLPCAHPNCHSLAYAYRRGDTVIPLNRFIDMEKNFDLLANGILFTKPRAAELIERLLGRLGCCAGGDCSAEDEGSPMVRLEPPNPSASQAAGTSEDPWSEVRQEFFMKALNQQLKAADVFRITLTSFLDAYNFDLRRLMKCCVHHVLPSGHVVPFCAYNVLYRDGHVQLPPLVAPADRLLNVGK